MFRKPRRKVLCMVIGLTRTYKKAYSNMMNHLIKNNESKYEFIFLLNTQDIDTEKLKSLQKYYTLPGHHLKGIMQYDCDKYPTKLNCNRYANQAYFLRLHQCLKSEQNNTYDLYINMRFDNILTKPIQLDNYTDKLGIITGGWTRPFYFHNRDWDLMSVGNYYNYILFHYPVLNDAIPSDPLPNVLMEEVIQEGITKDEINTIHQVCGLITEMPIDFYYIILKNMLKKNGRFCMSEQLDHGHIYLLR